MKQSITSSTSRSGTSPLWERTANALTYSHVWVGLIAGVQVVASALISPYFELWVTLRYALLVFFASISFYSFHRLYSLWTLLPNLPTDRWKVIYGFQRWLFALVPIGLVGALMLYFTLPSDWQWRVIVPALLSALYAIPLIKLKRLRDFGAAKVIWLSVGWLWLCTIVPLNALGEVNWWLVVERLFFLIGHTLAFDWRDTEQDQKEGVVTWPLRLGRKRTMWLSIGLLLTSLVFNTQIGGSELSVLANAATISFAATTIATLVVIPFAFAKTRPHHLYYGFVIDGLMVLQGVLLVLLLIYRN